VTAAILVPKRMNFDTMVTLAETPAVSPTSFPAKTLRRPPSRMDNVHVIFVTGKGTELVNEVVQSGDVLTLLPNGLQCIPDLVSVLVTDPEDAATA
jgi:hypothetical protein